MTETILLRRKCMMDVFAFLLDSCHAKHHAMHYTTNKYKIELLYGAKTLLHYKK